MKNLFLALAIGLAAMGCSRLEKGEQLTFDLVGTWELREVFDNAKWQQPHSYYYYQFKSDSTFTSNREGIECPTGTYSVKDSILSLKYDCYKMYPPTTLLMTIKGSLLYLTPAYLNCDEGCTDKLQKISNQ